MAMALWECDEKSINELSEAAVLSGNGHVLVNVLKQIYPEDQATNRPDLAKIISFSDTILPQDDKTFVRTYLFRYYCRKIDHQAHDLSPTITSLSSSMSNFYEKTSKQLESLKTRIDSLKNAPSDSFKSVLVDLESGEDLKTIISKTFTDNNQLSPLERQLTTFFLCCRRFVSQLAMSRDFESVKNSILWSLGESLQGIPSGDTISLPSSLNNLFNVIEATPQQGMLNIMREELRTIGLKVDQLCSDKKVDISNIFSPRLLNVSPRQWTRGWSTAVLLRGFARMTRK
ncbi:uncharacterized protein LOC118761442 [Octopus sinensis]|uniref:Uncharacterized protein LOC118761442 n=1 Tax=Octopus sinensis TaxID=2607531 RepID=A0A7E6EJS0_9MOLL|nr:uncharacterized protein LOC118761442 [Octopus sinensis]